MVKRRIALLALLLFPIVAHSQALLPMKNKTAYFSAGAFYSIAQTDYGQNNHRAKGFGAYSDLNYLVWRRLGVGAEGEVRFIQYDLIAGTHFQNFLGGPRFTYHTKHFEPYVKALAGGSRFYYPSFISKKAYTYTTYAIGGGLDIKVTNHFSWRVADFESQRFVNYPPHGLTPWTLSTGISYRIF